MKTTIIVLTALIALTSTAQADYRIVIPMEQSKGGALPNSSISFKQVDVVSPEPIPTVPDGPWDCLNQRDVYPEECEKRLTAWEVFVTSNGIANNLNILSAVGKNLSSLPNEQYPLTSLSGIYLANNQLTNLDSLENITNINGTLHLIMNPLTNLNGIRNISAGSIVIDKNYNGPKLPASSRFCTLNNASKFYAGYAEKGQICEQ